MKTLQRKTRISVTILPNLNLMIEKESKRLGISKSELVEEAIKKLLKNQLIEDAKKLATLKFKDLPSDEEWASLDSELDIYDR